MGAREPRANAATDATTMKRAVVLLSGGLDSATVLAWMRREGYACHALSFHYGQRHAHELARASEIARALGAAEHKVAEIDLRAFGGSALTADDIAVPKDRNEGEIARGVPVTYVPARNTIFLAFALAYAETIGASDLAIGVNAIDYSGYPDCRPEFIAAFERLAKRTIHEEAHGHVLPEPGDDVEHRQLGAAKHADMIEGEDPRAHGRRTPSYTRRTCSATTGQSLRCLA
jgi:queuosine biosynthesis protein QueC